MKNVLLVLSVVVLNQSFATPAQALGMKRTRVPTPVATPTPSPAPTATPAPTPAVSPTPTSTPVAGNPDTLPNGAPTCTSSDSTHICIGLKIVSYLKNGVPGLTQDQAITLLNGINKIWSQCNIAFQLESYEAVDPTTLNLSYNVNWQNDGDIVRSNFNDHSTFLVVTVGTLTGSTIAVTEMPGASVFGTLVEQAYSSNPMTVGHELGHYQGLYHISNSTNLMNPYIGDNTSGLTASQCSTARATDYSNWQSMMRYPSGTNPATIARVSQR